MKYLCPPETPHKRVRCFLHGDFGLLATAGSSNRVRPTIFAWIEKIITARTSKVYARHEANVLD
jgi:hypothetical protein